MVSHKSCLAHASALRYHHRTFMLFAKCMWASTTVCQVLQECEQKSMHKFCTHALACISWYINALHHNVFNTMSSTLCRSLRVATRQTVCLCKGHHKDIVWQAATHNDHSWSVMTGGLCMHMHDVVSRPGSWCHPSNLALAAPSPVHLGPSDWY